MVIAIVIVALAMVAAGIGAIVTGAEIIVLERGWSSVIAGSIVATGGMLLVGIALLVRELRRLPGAIDEARAGPVPASPATDGANASAAAEPIAATPVVASPVAAAPLVVAAAAVPAAATTAAVAAAGAATAAAAAAIAPAVAMTPELAEDKAERKAADEPEAAARPPSVTEHEPITVSAEPPGVPPFAAPAPAPPQLPGISDLFARPRVSPAWLGERGGDGRAEGEREARPSVLPPSAPPPHAPSPPILSPPILTPPVTSPPVLPAPPIAEPVVAQQIASPVRDDVPEPPEPTPAPTLPRGPMPGDAPRGRLEPIFPDFSRRDAADAFLFADAVDPPSLDAPLLGDRATGPAAAAETASPDEPAPETSAADRPPEAAAPAAAPATPPTIVSADSQAGPSPLAEADTEGPDSEDTDDGEPEIIGTYSSGGNLYVMFSDGSIAAETPEGVFRFESLEELKEYIAAGAANPSDDKPNREPVT